MAKFTTMHYLGTHHRPFSSVRFLRRPTLTSWLATVSDLQAWDVCVLPLAPSGRQLVS